MKKNGFLVISLDFELLWGVFDVLDFENLTNYFKNTKAVIPQILEEFEVFDIHATWAIVGMLFNKDWEEWRNNIPGVIPHYANNKLSPYNFGKSIEEHNIEELCFAPEVIKKIKKVPGQEIATHTYSHYYCLEEGQTMEDFQNDLKRAVELAQKENINLKSLVFPRNQFRKEYLEVCEKMGITTVRSNPSSWYWKNTRSEAIFTKIARTGDAYIPLGHKSYRLEEIKKEDDRPVEQKASRFLRPPENNLILRKLKTRRIKREMTLAAKRNEIYHLWWHPHNFGDNPAQAMKDLKEILMHYQKLAQRYNFQSANMQDILKLL